MRTQILCLAVLGVGAALVLSGGQDATAAITGSSHDFKSATWNQGGSAEICEPCHAPHTDGTYASTAAPLWNRASTTSTFTLYTSGTLTATDVGQPSGVSKLCLSCHDGTVALEAFAGNSQVTTTYVTGNALLGIDLNNHHPVAFTYNATLATNDGGLYDPTATASGLAGGGNIDDDLLFGTGNDQLECSSCHDVHNGYTQSKLLVMSNASSALCLTCHNK